MYHIQYELKLLRSAVFEECHDLFRTMVTTICCSQLSTSEFLGCCITSSYMAHSSKSFIFRDTNQICCTSSIPRPSAKLYSQCSKQIFHINRQKNIRGHLTTVRHLHYHFPNKVCISQISYS